MGKEEKKAPIATSPKNANQADKKKNNESAKEKEEARRMKKKETQGDPKAGPGEDVHTCWGCRFPLLAALLQLALGASVIALGFIMAGASSSLLVRDTPYWAGIIVSIASLFLPFGSALASRNAKLACIATLHLGLTHCMLYYTLLLFLS